MRTHMSGRLALLARLAGAITRTRELPGPAGLAAPNVHRHRLPRGASVLAAVGVATLALPLLGVATASAASPSATEVIHADVLPDVTGGPARLTPTGSPPPGEVLTIGVGLMLPDLSVVRAYYHAEYTVGNAAYHKFLTPAEFASRFGVNPSTYGRVLAWLKNGGLAVTQTAAARDWVEATGSVAQIEALMQLQIAKYQVKGVGFLANTTAPTVPAGDSIYTVVGLNTLQHFTPAPLGPPPNAAKPTVPRPAQGTTTCATTLSCFYNPSDLWSMYQMPSQNEGQGQQIGIFGEGQSSNVISDLRVFEQNNHLPQVPVTVIHVGPGPFTDNSGQIEWNLDSQASTGMAPDAYGVKLYFANSLTDASVESMFQAWVSDPTAPLQANASFGECETSPGNAVFGSPLANPNEPAGQGLGNNLEPVAEQTLLQAASQGQTLFSSAGDTGGSCPIAILPVVGAGNGIANQGLPLQNYPAASRYAVGVGGTVLYSNGLPPPAEARFLEKSWTYTGGGPAPFISEPFYQKADANVNIPCTMNDVGTPYPAGTICRGVPDVAAMSGNIYDNGYNIVVGGAATTEGGTSLSSPLWVGMWARVQAAAPAGGLGFANPTIYKVGEGSSYTTDFFDVTVGCNGQHCAGPGWDYTSGWGVMNVTPFMQTVDGRLTPTNDVLPPAPSGGTGTPLACGDLWQNPSHTATGGLQGNPQPQLTLDAGTMGVNQAGTPPVLEVTIQVQNLSTHVPTGASAEDWYGTWTYGSTEYFAYAQLSAAPGASVTYGDGTASKTGTTTNYAPAHTDTGSFNQGANGTVVVNVPLTNVGSPPLGAVLLHPAAVTFTEEGTPPNPATSAASLQQVDSGGPDLNYTVGGVIPCSGASPGGTVPEAPWAPLIPLLGLGMLLASGFGLRRLQRHQIAG